MNWFIADLLRMYATWPVVGVYFFFKRSRLDVAHKNLFYKKVMRGNPLMYSWMLSGIMVSDLVKHWDAEGVLAGEALYAVSGMILICLAADKFQRPTR